MCSEAGRVQGAESKKTTHSLPGATFNDLKCADYCDVMSYQCYGGAGTEPRETASVPYPYPYPDPYPGQ